MRSEKKWEVSTGSGTTLWGHCKDLGFSLHEIGTIGGIYDRGEV